MAEDVRYLWQPRRLVLLNFQCLTAVFERCQNERRLKHFSREAVPIIINAFNLLMWDFWTRPRIPAKLEEARQGLVEDWQSNGLAGNIHEWILGERPLAYEIPELLTPENIVGCFRTSPHNFLLNAITRH